MAKPIHYVVELTKEEAQRFIDDVLNPKPNPIADATIKRAKNLYVFSSRRSTEASINFS